MGVSVKPRLAIIGCGAVVDVHLIPSLRRIGWLPTVLVDKSEERLDHVARNMGAAGKAVVKATDWSKVADQFDAVIIATPQVFHGPLGLALAKAGKHIFMEKPLATTSAECEAMIAAATESGVSIRVGLLRRFIHAARWLKGLIDSGRLGEIRRFDAREGFVFNWAVSSTSSIDPRTAGGGVLIDTGAHTIDLILWWLGEISEIDYRDDSVGGVEADCLLTCRLDSGAEGIVELSRTRDLRNTIRIEGTEGFVEMHLYENKVLAASDHVWVYKDAGIDPREFPMQRFADLFDAELRTFLACATDRGRPGVSAEDGARSVALIERCYKERKPMVLPWNAPQTGATPEHQFEIPRGATVVITGASGFIGGRLAERLVCEYDAKVRCIVRDVGHATRLARLPVEIIKADLADAAAMDKAVAGADYVFHCAYDGRSRGQNMEGTRNLIDASLKHDVKRFVYVSTVSVYEPLPDGPLSETTRDGDRSWVYARNKLDLEQMVFDAVKERNLPGTIVQPAIVYGPFCKPWTNAPAEMLLWGDVILPDKGEGLCSTVYIDDLIDGFLLAATKKEAIGERFLLSGPREVTWGEFFETFARTVGAEPPTYWPTDKIAKANGGGGRNIMALVKNPKRIVQYIVRWNPARRALQAGLDALPKPLHNLVTKYYFGGGGCGDARKIGEVFIPAKQTLALYSAKATIDNAKAREMLGYQPRFDFAAGMVPTGQYLEWAYGDIGRTVRAQRQAAKPAKVGAVGLANAD